MDYSLTINILAGFIAIMVTLTVTMLTYISKKLSNIEDKLFTHLTNDEMHSPRSVVAYKAECQIFQNFLEKNLDDIKGNIKEIFKIIDKK